MLNRYKYLLWVFLTLPSFGQNIDVSRVRGVGYVSDESFLTLPAACASAVSQGLTLQVSKSWTALTTQSLTCAITFVTGGMIQPANGQTVTFANCPQAGPFQIFDLSASGSILVPSKGCSVNALWNGIKADGTTDNSSLLTALFTSGATDYTFPAGVYRYNTAPTLPTNGATFHCGSTAVFRSVASGHGMTLNLNIGSVNTVFENCAFTADGATSTDALYLNNTYGVTLIHPWFADPATFGITPASSNHAAELFIDNTGGGNSNAITLLGAEFFQGSGDAIHIHSDLNSGLGAQGVVLTGGHIHGYQGWGINGVADAFGAHRISVYGTTIEGNALGMFNCDWCIGIHLDNIDFENSANQSTPLVVLGNNGGTASEVEITNSNFACVLATSGIKAFFGINMLFARNTFTNCSTSGITYGGAASQNITYLDNQRGVGTPAIYTPVNTILYTSKDTPNNGTVNTSGTTVTRTAGSLFNASGSWNGFAMLVNSVAFVISSCGSTTTCTLATSAGTQTGVTFSVPQAGGYITSPDMPLQLGGTTTIATGGSTTQTPILAINNASLSVTAGSIAAGGQSIKDLAGLGNSCKVGDMVQNQIGYNYDIGLLFNSYVSVNGTVRTVIINTTASPITPNSGSAFTIRFTCSRFNF